MAEGLAKNIFGDIATIISAGSQPSLVNLKAIKVMAEIGIDISNQNSKSIDTIDLSSINMIVTLCSEEICPNINSTVKKEHWPLPDPARFSGNKIEQLAQFRQIRDELKLRIESLKNDLQNQNKSP
jgi:arsenate reductase